MTTTPAKFTLTLPPSLSGDKYIIENTSSIVIVGANGSGKTRLGSWIEFDSSHNSKVHRISAQKSLTMPDRTSPKPFDIAEEELLYGKSVRSSHYLGSSLSNKRNVRWKQKPAISFLDDYSKLMVYLFSEDYEKSTKYRSEAKQTKRRIEPPKTMLDIVKRIWESLLPHRELIIGGGNIEAKTKDDVKGTYNASEMSDGERVAFYLIGQCLAAPKEGIIVIDEPEIHLHRSIQSSLWNAIEAERDDCLFVYLTHDLDFAATRSNATKIWLKSYDGKAWDWQIVPTESNMEEALLLSILGSRRPALFVEGGESSLDYFFLSHLYLDYTIIPCGGCTQVITATKSFQKLKHWHRLECYGLVDRDFRTQEQINGLKDKGIYVLQLSEVENLLLAEEVVRVFANDKLFEDVEKRVKQVKDSVLSELKKKREKIISSLVTSKVRDLLNQFDTKAKNKVAIKESLKFVNFSIDIDAIYSETAKRIDKILNENDYKGAIEVFNHKGLIYEVARHLGMEGKEYKRYAKQLLASKRGQPIVEAMKNYVPSIP